MPKTEPFEQHSDAYEQWFDEHPDVYALELAAIRELLPPVTAKTVEVGVGSGLFAQPLGIRCGVEPSTAMAARARQRGIQVFPASAEHLPFESASVDCILMVTALCFFDDPAHSLGEAWRVLQAGSSIVIGFIDKDSELGQRYQQHRDSSVFYRDARFYSSAEVGQLLQNATFEALRWCQTLIPDTDERPLQAGFGKGAFVVVSARKAQATVR